MTEMAETRQTRLDVIPALHALVEERGLVPARLGDLIGFLNHWMEIEQLEEALDLLHCVLSREHSAARYEEESR
jgi:hypothetical protein